ncbi:PREDICTED: E3 ubiquitin-protein ligase RNF135-like [Nanorana parkeri]|uniref:E3 ubiquitin-protein ligase RNF135-like n=1 Tax=Nanorana parkeri TaxID=125878 RepID=UPI00085465FC|nr:PREDICTED: E3 ubiquitin-protein ligase RNF135-like [Nanorana parkeri]
MKDNLTQDFRDMRDYLEKQERASFWRMQQEQEMAKKSTSQDIQILVADIESLMKVKVELQDRIENDWMAVLKDSGSGGTWVSAAPPNKRYTFDENRLVDTTEVISKIRKSLLSHSLLEQVPCPPKQVFEDPLVLPAPPGPDVQMPSTTLPERSPNRLLQWATHISFDPQTVNNRLSLSEDLKTVTVTNKIKAYEKSGRRFSASQVLAVPEFSSDCHYWEFSTKDSDGWGVGAAAAQMGRDGKLGRNAFSWCVEWNKDQLCAWHNDQGVPVLLPRPLNVGVLLDCPEKELKFYSISEDGPTRIHSFPLPLQSPIFPAVWLYGLKAGNSLTIRDLQRISM